MPSPPDLTHWFAPDSLRQAAIERGYEVVEQFVDEGYSGAHLERPALIRLRDLAAEGAIEVLLVYAPDRLARHYAYQVVVLDELRLAGCEVIFLNHPFGASPEERMFLQIHGVFAEYERALIKERLRRGRLYAAREGGVNWGGNPPYGYRYIPGTETTPGKLVVDATEAEIVRQMFRWLVEEEMTTYAITERLNTRVCPRAVARERGAEHGQRHPAQGHLPRRDALQPYDGRRCQTRPHGPRLQGSATRQPARSRRAATARSGSRCRCP